MPDPADDPYFATRQGLAAQINRDRASANLAPVELDLFTSLVADHHCQEMAGYRYLSHWDLQGLLPYHRYHNAGGRDHVQENLSRLTIYTTARAPISTEPNDLLPRLLESHARFVAEQPPSDGHRRTIFDPTHTHVGIGLAVVGGEFTMSEQFINRYVRLSELPATFPAGPIRIEGEMLRQAYGPYYCMVFYEGQPQPRTVYQLERTYAYSDMDGEECASVPPWQMQFDSSRGRFRFTLRTKDCGPGLYHLILWVRNNVRSIPYQLSNGATKIETKYGVVAAGWVFRK